MSFKGTSILSVDAFSKDNIAQVFAVADSMLPYALRQRMTKVLEGAVLGSLFFEPSTRTRISFGCAFNLLGGFVRETTGMESTSFVKGESLYDAARVISGYSDAIVMRHPKALAVADFAKGSRAPVINAGDGGNEHPTQALLDLYTINKELEARQRQLSDARVALIGDLKYGRTAHSLLKLLLQYKNISLTLISPPQLSLPESLLALIKQAGHRCVVSDVLTDHIRHVDVMYVTRVQEERFDNTEQAQQYKGLYALNQATYTRYCEPNTVILHPLPRDSRAGTCELDPDLNNNPNLAIFRQADNGVLIRMALFALLFGVEKDVDVYSQPMRWSLPRVEM